MFVLADKTTNFYAMPPSKYKELMKKNIKKEYKKASDDSLNTINAQSKSIAANLGLDNRIELLAPKNSFISLKDHKENFSNEVGNWKSEQANPRSHRQSDCHQNGSQTMEKHKGHP